MRGYEVANRGFIAFVRIHPRRMKLAFPHGFFQVAEDAVAIRFAISISHWREGPSADERLIDKILIVRAGDRFAIQLAEQRAIQLLPAGKGVAPIRCEASLSTCSRARMSSPRLESCVEVAHIEWGQDSMRCCMRR